MKNILLARRTARCSSSSPGRTSCSRSTSTARWRRSSRDPERAAMRRSTRGLLVEVAERCIPCIVISGRARADVATLAGRRAARGRSSATTASSPGRPPRPLMDEVSRWLPLLGRRLASLKGVQIEDKIVLGRVHYRRSREKKQGARGDPGGRARRSAPSA